MNGDKDDWFVKTQQIVCSAHKWKEIQRGLFECQVCGKTSLPGKKR